MRDVTHPMATAKDLDQFRSRRSKFRCLDWDMIPPCLSSINELLCVSDYLFANSGGCNQALGEHVLD